MKSRVGLERFYNLKKELLRVFVVSVLGGSEIDHGWMVKRVLILMEMGERTCV